MAAQIIAFPKSRIARSKSDQARTKKYFKQFQEHAPEMPVEERWRRSVKLCGFADFVADRVFGRTMPSALAEKVAMGVARAPEKKCRS